MFLINSHAHSHSLTHSLLELSERPSNRRTSRRSDPICFPTCSTSRRRCRSAVELGLVERVQEQVPRLLSPQECALFIVSINPDCLSIKLGLISPSTSTDNHQRVSWHKFKNQFRISHCVCALTFALSCLCTVFVLRPHLSPPPISSCAEMLQSSPSSMPFSKR